MQPNSSQTQPLCKQMAAPRQPNNSQIQPVCSQMAAPRQPIAAKYKPHAAKWVPLISQIAIPKPFSQQPQSPAASSPRMHSADCILGLLAAGLLGCWAALLLTERFWDCYLTDNRYPFGCIGAAFGCYWLPRGSHLAAYGLYLIVIWLPGGYHLAV